MSTSSIHTAAAVAAADVLTAVWLDPTAVQVGSIRVEHGTPSASSCERSVNRLDRTPCVLLPMRGAEPLRADLQGGGHPRGCGDIWPPEAMSVPDQAGNLGSRLPLMVAWPQLLNGGSRPFTYLNAYGELTDFSDYSDAIATAVQQSLISAPKRDGTANARPVIVVPDRLSTRGQQDILDCCSRRGLEVRLLWRPVAAAISWCEKFDRDLIEKCVQDGKPIGSVLSIYLGAEGWELTSLEVVAHKRGGSTFSLLPARRRPKGKIEQSSSFFGPSMLSTLVTTSVESTIGNQPRASKCHERLWADRWLPNAIQSLTKSPRSDTEALHANWRQRVLKTFSVPSEPEDAILKTFLPGPWTLQNFTAARNYVSQFWRDTPPLGVVLSGALAGLPMDDGTPMGIWFLKRAEVNPGFVLVENADTTLPILDGALLAAARIHDGRIPYLDQLPSLRTVAVRRGKPLWEDLIDPDGTYVPGGVTWKRKQPMEGLAIAANTSDLTIALSHGEEEHLVRLTEVTNLDESDTMVPVQIEVNVEPAQGDAKLVVSPTPPNSGFRPFTVRYFGRDNFARRPRDNPKGKEVTPDEYLEDEPLVMPPLLPRLASRGMWVRGNQWNPMGARKMVEEALAIFRTGALPNYEHLNNLRNVFRGKDPVSSRYNRDSTAVGSDGHSALASDQPNLDELTDHLVNHLLRSGNDRNRSVIVRALAYMSTPNNTFIGYLSQSLRVHAVLDDDIVVACGQCLRDTTLISKFLSKVAGQLEPRVASGLSLETIKAIARIFRYRENAADKVRPADAMSVLEYVAHELDQELRLNSMGQIFRASTLCVVYLLRMRSVDSKFLPPDSPLGNRLKDTFKRGQEWIVIHGAPTGSVNMSAALKNFSDFINQRGSGLVMIAE